MSEIASAYTDVWGRERTIGSETRALLERALGPRAGARAVRIAPGRCHEPEALAAGERVWGFAVQLYSLRSARNWGIGDFGDLKDVVALAARLGAAVVGVNPLHAGGVSPYSPSSRHALNYLYLDVQAIPEFERSRAAQHLVGSRAFLARVSTLRRTALVDHAGVAQAKREVLELLFDALVDRRGFEAFRRSASHGVRMFALFEALREKLGDGWQRWPAAYRNPASRTVAAFARRYRRRVDFHLYVQWNARLQLDAVQRHARALGMPIGLYFDLALGADAGGAEVWSDQAAYAIDCSIGAPPDEFNPRGQDWGLPPYSPRRLRAARYRPFIELLQANMPEGGALRMDHVMSLMRLWWIPRGRKPEEGGYVHYPFRELLALLARESRARRCMVIGEDLGTVLPEFRQALNEAGVLSYRPLLFEKRPDGEYASPREYPAEALTCVSTHDLPTWKGFLEAGDLDLRESLGMTVDAAAERQSRSRDKEKLLAALAREGLDASAASAHRFLARTPCKILVIQPEDVFGVAEQANLPGTIDQHPNWRRKLPVPLESWAGDERVQALRRALAGERGAGPRLPRATYRVQFHKGFRFADALRLVPYLAALGVSHLYASPFLKARPGSLHGYDVVDPNAVNPEIGTEAELQALISALRRHGMGLVLDVVPNHMGVLQGDNAWWQDVLEKGRASPYARYFDIDWHPAKAELRGKVLLPVLGRHYGEALEQGEIGLVREGKRVLVRYYDHRFPLNARSARNLQPRKFKDPLALHRLLERQHYRLAFWRVASDEINYRRFFEITELGAVRVEDPAVFEATHALVARLARRPGVDGLRIDHPDGLADPAQYLERLAALRPGAWVVIEKILADYETLPEGWRAHGTTGYRYANLVTGLFVDRAAEPRFTRIYERFTGERHSFDEIAYASRMLIMNTTLAAELDTLATKLARIAAGNRSTRDYTVSGLRKALAEIAGRFPVYRTYVTARGASDTDRRYIDWAVKLARRKSRIADPSVFDFVQSVLTLQAAPPAGPRRAAMIEFARRFQQFTAPVVAKGVEDTAFYRYHRLVALNEVGGDPRDFGISLKAFHAASEDRARHWPHTMIATSTHDTKRSEDVRARLVVLSELASTWRMLLRRWSVVNRSRRTEVEGGSLPSRADEYLFYQALLGIWPARAPDAKEIEALRGRLKAYMLKAVREAKVHTSWINPDAEYEAALERFVAESLDNPLFLKELEEAVPRIAHLGLLVGLSQAVLKVASPGVPDYYQGTELWDFSLVDPDNRRPVDYERRKALLSSLSERRIEDCLQNLPSGEAKLHVIVQGLRLRREMTEVFQLGRYTPLYADGGMEERICAFALEHDGRAVVAIAPRLFASMVQGAEGAPLGDAWGDARLPLPDGELVNVLTGERHAGGVGRLADLLRVFPVALLATSAGSSGPAG